MVSLSKTYNVYGITAIVAISGLLLGLETASLANVLNSQPFEDYFTPLSLWERIMVESGNAIGAVFGCVLSGALYDNIGCICTFQLAGGLWIGGTAVVVFSPNIPLIVCGRCLKGVALGFISTGIPVYISETIPPKQKGVSMSIVQLSSAIGSLGMYFCSYFFQTIFDNQFYFKYVWAVEGIPSVLLLILCFFLPESPKWLAYKSRWSEAAKSLNKIRKYNELEPKFPVDNLNEKDYVLRAYTAGPEIKNCTYGHIFGKKYWKHTAVGIIAQVFVSLTAMGILANSFIFICEVCGVPSEDVQIFMSSQYIIVVVFTLFPIFLLDDCRRKDALVFGFFILGIANLAIFILAKVFGERIQDTIIDSPFDFDLYDEPASAFLAVFLFLYATYASTIVSTSWLYISEIFPGMARAKGSAVCMCAAWITNANLALFYPIIMEFIGVWIFVVTSFCCIIGSVIFIWFPETRDLDEIEIESIFVGKMVQNHEVPDIDYLVSKSLNEGLKQNKDLDYHYQNKVQVVPTTAMNENDESRSMEDVFEVERISQVDEVHINEYGKDISEDDNRDQRELVSPSSSIDEIPITEAFSMHLKKSLSLESLFTNESQDEKNASNYSAESPTSEAAVTATVDRQHPKISQLKHSSERDRYRKVSDFINEYKADTLDNASVDSYYSSDWYENMPLKESKKNLRQQLNVNLDSGNQFFHGNREGSPKKAGITYEPTAFLHYDTLKMGHKPSLADGESDNNDSIPSIDRLNTNKSNLWYMKHHE